MSNQRGNNTTSVGTFELRAWVVSNLGDVKVRYPGFPEWIVLGTSSQEHFRISTFAATSRCKQRNQAFRATMNLLRGSGYVPVSMMSNPVRLIISSTEAKE